MSVIGADKVMRKLSRLDRKVKAEVDLANQKSGEELIAISKVLIPKRTGESVKNIKGKRLEDGSYLCDFGEGAKVIEGDLGPRPFVNPALKVSRKRFKARAKRAVNKAVKASFNG